METNNEIKDFNIAEALRYAPKGLKLYSPLLGEVRLEKISDHDDTILVTTKYKSERVFFEDGKYDLNGECLLFPSINHRCWQHWQNTLFLESIGSMCVDTITGNKFILGEDGTYFSDNTGGYYPVIIENDLGNYFLNSRYASPEEAKEFFDELEKNGYEWDGKMVVKSTSQPKFKVGDWIVDNCNNVWQVVEVSNNFYRLKNINESESLPKIKWVNETFHLWSVKDAKDGDVLTNDSNSTFIFKEEYIAGKPTAYCGIIDGDFFAKTSGCWTNQKCYPATKGQTDFLFQKIKEKGYKWDVDAKKLIKTTTPIPKFKFGDIIKHKPTGQINTIKYVCSDYYILDNNNALFFESQDIWELAASKVKPTLEEKVNVLADEIIALKQRVLALEIQVIKDMSTPPLTKDPILYPDKVTCDDTLCHKGKCVSDVFKTPDKAGDNVTLKDMNS